MRVCVCMCTRARARYYVQKFEQLCFFPVTTQDNEEVLIAVNRLWLHILSAEYTGCGSSAAVCVCSQVFQLLWFLTFSVDWSLSSCPMKNISEGYFVHEILCCMLH